MPRRQVVGPQRRPPVVQHRQGAACQQLPVIRRQRRVGHPPQVRPGHLQRQRQAAQQGADGLRLAVLRVPRIQRRAAALGAQQQLQGRPFRQHAHFHSPEPPHVPPPRGEQQPAGQRADHQLARQRPVQVGRVGQVVQHQQRAGVLRQIVRRCPPLLGGRQADGARPHLPAHLGQPVGQRLGSVHPKDAIWVRVTVEVHILDRELCLADAPLAGQPRRPDAHRPLAAGLRRALQRGVQPLQVLLAADEIGVAHKGHDEIGAGPWHRAQPAAVALVLAGVRLFHRGQQLGPQLLLFTIGDDGLDHGFEAKAGAEVGQDGMQAGLVVA